MKSVSAVLISALALSASACSSDPWVGYEESLYSSLQAPSPEATAARAEFLEEVVERAESRGTRPPPGFAAECALYQIRRGRPDRAREFLDLEVRHYPESEKLVSALRRLAAGDERALPESNGEDAGDSPQEGSGE